MKSKVTVAKDEAFVATRTRVIERFFTRLLNDPEYHPDTCKEIKEFLSSGREFEARRQIEKGGGGMGSLWNKLKTYFPISKENKYKEHEGRIIDLKTGFEALCVHTQALIRLIQEERAENERLQQLPDPSNYLSFFRQLIISHDEDQSHNLTALQGVEFALFCENEDLLMAKRIIDRMNELRNDEDSYGELRHTEEKFNSKIDNFLIEKAKTRVHLQE